MRYLSFCTIQACVRKFCKKGKKIVLYLYSRICSFEGYSSHSFKPYVLVTDWLGTVDRQYLAYFSDLKPPPPLLLEIIGNMQRIFCLLLITIHLKQKSSAADPGPQPDPGQHPDKGPHPDTDP
jgi:hypothetical protein